MPPGGARATSRLAARRVRGVTLPVVGPGDDDVAGARAGPPRRAGVHRGSGPSGPPRRGSAAAGRPRAASRRGSARCRAGRRRRASARRANARSASGRASGTRSRRATGIASSGVTESATTATIRGRGAATSAAGASGSVSAAASRPSPRTATAASAVIPPIDVPTSATRRIPRSPSQARAPATSSTSSKPNVVGPSSEPPWPRKSSPSTPAVRRRNGPSSTRSGAIEPVQPWSRRIASCGSGTQPSSPGSDRGEPAAGQAHAVARAEPDDLAAERVEGGPQRGLVRVPSAARRSGSRDRRSTIGPRGPDHDERGRGRQQEAPHQRDAGGVVGGVTGGSAAGGGGSSRSARRPSPARCSRSRRPARRGG